MAKKAGFCWDESCLRTVQILHRVAEKHQLIDSIFADSMSEGITADAQQFGGLNLIAIGFLKCSVNEKLLDSREYIGINILP